MPPERAGYTVTMFLVDVSRTMGTTRTVELPEGPNGEERTTEMTNLEWALQYVKLKIQEMIYNGRKTDQCGVIIFGAEETKNTVHDQAGEGYENIVEYIPIATPNVATLRKLDALEPSTVVGDPLDALIVGIETQASYLGKKNWTRKIILVTDGENPIEVEEWEATVKKMDDLDISFTVVGVDFDDEEYGFEEEDKSTIKRANEKFFEQFTSSLQNGVMGTCAYALQEVARPEVKQTKSVLMGTVLRLGDTETRAEEAVEINIKTSKCTAISRPKSWKKFAPKRTKEGDEIVYDDEDGVRHTIYSSLKMRTEYVVDEDKEGKEDEEDGDVKMEEVDTEEGDAQKKKEEGTRIEKEELVRGFKYGTSYAPCPDGQFPRLPTRKGIDICGFFDKRNYRRDYSMGEIQYVWADPGNPLPQVALSSIVQAMAKKKVMAIARWVTKDGMDPKMGVLAPVKFDNVDCLLWAPVPFADDVRKYTFASLDQLVNKKGEILTEHPYLPTEEQQAAMDEFVDSMDLMDAGEKNEDGSREPWYNPVESYNPAIHRVKQAMFHCAVVNNLETQPMPPPHPELLKYFDPPKKVLKRSKEPLEKCKNIFKVREVPKKVARARKDGHVHAQDDDEEMLLLDRKPSGKIQLTATQSQSQVAKKSPAKDPEESVTEDESDGELILDKIPAFNKKKANQPLPTPARSVSPQDDAAVAAGREPGRIIGSTYPLKDFKKNLEQGDVVSKAMEDMGAVITDIVMRPFAKRRQDECIECMKAMRDTALKEDEIEAWNSFLEDLKDKCTSGKHGNKEFWEAIHQIGRGIGLISEKEAKKYGGQSDVSEASAAEFLDA